MTSNPEHVFVVTGCHTMTPDGQKVSLDSAETKGYYVIAKSDYAASQTVLRHYPDFVPMGCTTLAELKKFVVDMEAVRLGIKKPLGFSILD